MKELLDWLAAHPGSEIRFEHDPKTKRIKFRALCFNHEYDLVFNDELYISLMEYNISKTGMWPEVIYMKLKLLARQSEK